MRRMGGDSSTLQRNPKLRPHDFMLAHIVWRFWARPLGGGESFFWWRLLRAAKTLCS
jgi:hypothetical protein